MLRILHCLDNLLTDGGKIVSCTHWPCSTPQKHYFPASVTHFCYKLSKPQDLMRREGFDKLKKNSFTSPGLLPMTLRLVACCLNHYTTVYHTRGVIFLIIKQGNKQDCNNYKVYAKITSLSVNTINKRMLLEEQHGFHKKKHVLTAYLQWS
jgi:hypothetical protein